MQQPCSRFRVLAAVWLLTAIGSGCGTLSVADEKALGAEFSREARKELTFVRDDVVVGYVDGLGREILAAAPPQAFEYQFYVVEDDAINAFAAPGGYIYIHTETILKSTNVSELAGVMAHEIGHVAKRHIAHNYNRQRSTGYAHQVAVLATNVLLGGAAAGAVNLGGGLAASAYLNSFGRDAEREADAFAVQVMPGAGYHPEGLVSFFRILQSEGGGGVPEFLSSHPATSERMANTRRMIREQQLPPGLKTNDGGKLEIIQRRIRLLTGKTGASE